VNVPETRWAKAADGTYLAYQVFGDGPVDVLYIPGFASHVEIYWEYPAAARFFHRLGQVARVIWFDKRGTGLSDRVTTIPDLETMVDDVRAVLDAAGSKRTVLWGDGPDGGGACAVFAATQPDRTLAFVWWGAMARSAWAPDYPWGDKEEDAARDDRFFEEAWGRLDRAREMLESVGCRSINDEPEAQRWITKLYRYSNTPGGVVAFGRMWGATDVRSVLPAIHVPTAVVKREEDTVWGSADEQQYITQRIAGARAVRVPGTDFPPFLGDLDATFAVIEDFLDSVRHEEAELDRVLATVMFTDIVDSTVKAVELGDRRWKELVEQHHAHVRGFLARYRGRELDTAGDGFFAAFDGPARAIRCATAIEEAVHPLGIEVRAGLHTGECEMIDDKPGGVAVVIGARIGALAGSGEVLVSQTVKDLVAGSGLTFEDAGEHELKGVPDRWHLYRVASP
jgi:class 3 adenylate cyclase/pimeloyl-ACP methyl ester carboxylesterase